MSTDWYYLDKDNVARQFSGSYDDPFWREVQQATARTRENFNPHTSHGVRPCSWERVRYTELGEACFVSTVFLGLDHSYSGPPPLVFESMAFWGVQEWDPPDPKMRDSALGEQAYDSMLALYESRERKWFYEEWDCERWSTWDQAVAGHEEMVKRLKTAVQKKAAETLVELRRNSGKA